MGMEIGLLDYLAFKAGCTYLSDLHQPENLRQAQHVLRHWTDPDAFSLKEWNDAAAYLTGEQAEFETPRQALDYLKDYAAGTGKLR